jgi:hypothetical protein
VLDGTDLGQSLWNQMHHHHPMVAGYATRFPKRVLDSLDAEPTLKAFLPVPFSGPSSESAEQGRSALRRAGIRYVLLAGENEKEAAVLGLREIFRTDGLAIYSVPNF